jgi:hypothetical protein
MIKHYKATNKIPCFILDMVFASVAYSSNILYDSVAHFSVLFYRHFQAPKLPFFHEISSGYRRP